MIALQSIHLHAQDETGAPYDLPRVGSELDLNEIRYFQLFPYLYVEDGKRDVHVNAMWNGKDSVDFIVAGTDLPEDAATRRTISVRAGEVLHTLIKKFEEFACCMSPYLFYYSDMLADSLRPYTTELRQKGIVGSRWKAVLETRDLKKLRIVLRNDEQREGVVLGFTNRRLILWGDKTKFDPDSIQEKVFSVMHDNVRYILYGEDDHNTAGLFGLTLGLSLSFAPEFTREAQTDGYAGSIIARVLLVGLGLTAFAIATERDFRFDHTENSATHVSELSFAEQPGLMQGFPPELLDYLGFEAQERLLTSGDSWLPYAKGVPAETDVSTDVLHLGFDHLIIHTDGACCSSGFVSLDYGWWPEYLHSEAISLGSVLRGGVAFSGSVSAEASLASKLGPLEFSAGMRFLHFTNPLLKERRDWRSFSSSGSHNEFQENRPDDIGGKLYTSFGFGFTHHRLQVRLRFLQQLTPSVHIKTTSTQSSTSQPTSTWTDERTGIQLTAYSISAALQL
ncbi:hypothetical protein KQI65_15700 [bacterium]|nr:hypothetical protein [bacterium]